MCLQLDQQRIHTWL